MSAIVSLPHSAFAANSLSLGPLYHEFRLTLEPGERREAVGPLFYFEQKESRRLWASPPVFSYTLDEETDFEEFDFIYPFLSYDRFGDEYRFHIFQIFNFSGGQNQQFGTNAHRFSFFPFYFQQRSSIPEKNYTAVFPFYGRMENRLFRDEIEWVIWPLYVKTRRRAPSRSANEDPTAILPYRNLSARQGDITTYNYLYPIFHLRYGVGLKGWQIWPLTGFEHRDITHKTNHWDEVELIGGHDKFFLLWPLFFNQTVGIGTENPEKHQALLPLYSFMRSPQRDSTTYFWPFGVTHTEDRAKKYTEWGAPWPLIVFDRGEGKTTSRVWPFFSQSHNETLESNWYFWPIYKYNRVQAAPLDRKRTRFLLFLYSDLLEKNTESGAALHRRDFWPLFTARRDWNGNERLQIFALLEPLLPNNKSIERNYSPLWSLWRSEKNTGTRASSQSLLWNLYRRDATPETKKCSLLFGLFQYQSSPEGKRWRLLHIPIGKRKKPALDVAPGS